MPKPFNLLPGPKGMPIIGSVLDYSKFFGKHSFEKLHEAKRENYDRYGPIYRERLGRDVVQLFDPADIEAVFRTEGRHPQRPPLPLPMVAHRRDQEPLGLGLLTGDAWWRRRRAVQRCMMHPSAAAVYLAMQNNVADELLQHIANDLESYVTSYSTAKDGAELNDLLGLLIKYTMEAFGSVCFGKRLGYMEKDLSPQSEAFKMHEATSKMFQAVQKTTFSFPWYAMFSTPLYRQFVRSIRLCHGIARSHLDTAARMTASAPSPSTSNFMHTLLNSKQAKELSVDDIVGLATELFTAGIDSTAYAVGFCLYNLACNADKQAYLSLELEQVLPFLDSESRHPSVTEDTLVQLRYLKACVKESFRLNFPVEGGTVRILEQDLVLSDFVVPKGTLVALNNQTICLDERYFDNPNKFVPERWLKDGSYELRPAPNFVMLPFGYGPRMCIGRRFAEQEIYLALIKILLSYRLEYRHSEKVGMINRVFTMPDRPLRITFIPRRHAH